MRKLSILLFSCLSWMIFTGTAAFADEIQASMSALAPEAEISATVEEPHYLDVEDAFIPSLEQNERDISITFRIAEDYYLYLEKFKITPVNCEITDISFPEGIYHEDEYMGPSHVFYKEVTVNLKVQSTAPFPKINVQYQGCTEGMCYPPVVKKIAIDRLTENVDSDADSPAGPSGTGKDVKDSAETDGDVDRIPGADFTSLVDVNNDSSSIYRLVGGNILFGLFAFFCFGVLLSLTPCMFPMYPIWSSIILGRKQKSMKTTAVYTMVYIFGMAIAYMLAGFGIAYAGAQFQMFMQQPAVLIAMSVIFLILAVSMFGLFEMTLPTAWINKLQQINDRQQGGTVTGVFLMGVISAIIASPCTTAPLAGALMFIMKDGNILRGGAYLFIMGLGMGVPLAIIAVLGQKFLPKSGMWMKNIKVICGFIMLTIPLYLLRAYLTPSIITAISILMSGSILCYITLLVLKNRRTLFAMTTMIITAVIAVASLFITTDAKNSDIFEPVENLTQLEDLIKDNKIVIVDIRADWCASCRKYEETTFADKNVVAYMSPFKNVYVDITDPDAETGEIVSRYKKEITGAPTILIFRDHRLISSVNGYLPADAFIKRISWALEK